MKLTIKRSELDDWFIIEREFHESYPKSIFPHPRWDVFRSSARIGDADVEGTSAEMRAIARAIEDGGSEFFGRCAVCVHGDSVTFWSPRNTSDVGPKITRAEAEALAVEIYSMCPLSAVG